MTSNFHAALFANILRAACIFFLTSRAFCSAAQLQGTVVSIADGDTFTLLSPDKRQTKVRLYGIDAPEKGQAFSNQSTKYLSRLVFGKTVVVEARNRDRYGRLVAIARVGGMNVNEALLRGGFVWHYKLFDRNRAWAHLEQDARQGKRGLWADPHPVAPWHWRKQSKPRRVH